jgi:hypothetical protein
MQLLLHTSSHSLSELLFVCVTDRYNYVQIEENTKVLASLGYRFGAPTPIPGAEGRSESARIESPSTKHGRATPTDRWRDGARKALLAWVKELTTK